MIGQEREVGRKQWRRGGEGAGGEVMEPGRGRWSRGGSDGAGQGVMDLEGR